MTDKDGVGWLFFFFFLQQNDSVCAQFPCKGKEKTKQNKKTLSGSHLFSFHLKTNPFKTAPQVETRQQYHPK